MDKIIARIALADRLTLSEKTQALLDILLYFNDKEEYMDECAFNPNATTLVEMFDWELTFKGVGFWYRIAQCIGEDV